MKFTGERVVPGQVDPDLMNEHLARYRFAEQFAAGKTVLDIASGAGYGSSILGQEAKAVFGIDIDPEAVNESRRTYSRSNVFFSRSDCYAVPFADKRFDLVVAFEILEHLERPELLLNEIYRVLTDSGTAIISTPNRLYYTEERGEVNEFHHHEFTFQEFDEALRKHFPYCDLLLQNHVPAVLLSELRDQSASVRVPRVVIENRTKANPEGSSSAAEADSAYFFVAVCSKIPMPEVSGLIFLPSTGNVLRERERHIRRLTEYLDESRKETARAVEQLNRREGGITALQAGYEAQIMELNKHLEERTDWAMSLNRQISEKGEALQSLQTDYDSKVQWAISLDQEIENVRGALAKLQKEFDERTAWALQMKDELKKRATDIESLQERLQKVQGEYAAFRNNYWNRFGTRLRLNR